MAATSMSILLDQCRKPTGWLGRLFLWLMQRVHSKLAVWGLQQVSVGKGDTILDVGCGGGAMVRKLAAVAAEGKVYGVDHSEQSVAAARRANRKGTAEGRVEIRKASVSALPFPDDLFDLVTAVETHYFWPDLPAGGTKMGTFSIELLSFIRVPLLCTEFFPVCLAG